MLLSSAIAVAATVVNPSPWGETAHISHDIWVNASRYDTELNCAVFLDSSGTLRSRQLEQMAGCVSGTSAGFNVVIIKPQICREKTGAELLLEFKRLSGLSWEKIAEIADVSRRSIHKWAAGSNMSIDNHRLLGELVATMRYIDKGFGESNRDLIMTPLSSGKTVLELLVSGNFEEIKQAVGQGRGRAARLPVSEKTLNLIVPETLAEQIGRLSLQSDEGQTDAVITTVKPEYRRATPRRKKG